VQGEGRGGVDGGDEGGDLGDHPALELQHEARHPAGTPPPCSRAVFTPPPPIPTTST